MVSPYPYPYNLPPDKARRPLVYCHPAVWDECYGGAGPNATAIMGGPDGPRRAAAMVLGGQ